MPGTGTYRRGQFIDPVREFGADPKGNVDSTAAFNRALAEGSVGGGKGTFLINGVVNIPIGASFRWGGMSDTTFKLGPSGQIRRSARGSSGVNGGKTEGFTIDGQNAQNVEGGGFYVGNELQHVFEDINVANCVGDLMTVETAQNCIFNSLLLQFTGRSSLVLDYGTGGHQFNRLEFGASCLYGLEIRQSGPSLGGYPTFLGPSGNNFFGCIAEYPGGDTLADMLDIFSGTKKATAPAMLYHGAGNNNQFYGTAFNLQNMGQAGSCVIAESAANAIEVIGTATDGGFTITLAAGTDMTNIYALHAVSGPGILPGTIITDVTGRVLTLSFQVTGDQTNQTFGIGAISNQISMDGGFILGVTEYTTGFELRGGITITLSGRTVIEGQVNAFKTRANDNVQKHGPITYINVTNQWVDQVTSDPLEPFPNSSLSTAFDGQVSAATYQDPHIAFTGIRSGDEVPHFQVAPGAILLGNGVDTLGAAVLEFFKDTDDTVYVQSIGPFVAATLKVPGLEGASSEAEFVGQFLAPGPPLTGTWKTGQWGLDTRGIAYFCLAGGAPGTWSGAFDLEEVHLIGDATTGEGTAFTTPWGAPSSGYQPMFFYKDPFGLAHIGGVASPTATTSADGVVTQLPADYWPTAVRPFGAASMTSGGVYAYASLIDTDGTIKVLDAVTAADQIAFEFDYRVF